jgi:radical SAM superfamily enzyme YgiQ (UPF0313 family)
MSLLKVHQNIPSHPASMITHLTSTSLSGLKITFINMPLRESALPNTPPEGPAILAAIVRQYGAIPSILDLNAYRIKDKLAEEKSLPNGRHLTLKEAKNLIEKHLGNQGEQDIFAFSGMITTLKWQENIAKIIKKIQPKSFLISGNGLATELREGLFNWIPELDAIVRSEGDDVFVVACHDAKMIKESSHHNPHKITSLSPYFCGDINGKARFVYHGDRPKNLDHIPYAAWDLLESDPFGHNVLEDYIKVPVWGIAANNSSATPFTMKRSLTTVSSRGCPYACTFCYRGAQGERNYGMRSPEHIAQQIRGYVDKYDLDFMGFPDDNFAVDKRRIKKMIPTFKKYGLDKVRWGTHTRMDEADARAFDMAESGCVYIGFGAESADENTLTFMKKGGFILKNGFVEKKINGNTYKFPKTMTDAVKNCKSAGIHANCTWIMAYPGETLDFLKTSVAFITWQQEFVTQGITPGTPEYEIALESVNTKMFTATAYPGTEMWNEVKPQLSKHFDTSFDSDGRPVCDDKFHKYVLELDDATKVLNDKNNNPVNFSKMSMDEFLQAREHIDSGNIQNILSM